MFTVTQYAEGDLALQVLSAFLSVQTNLFCLVLNIAKAVFYNVPLFQVALLNGNVQRIWAERAFAAPDLHLPSGATVASCLYSGMQECRSEAVRVLPGNPSKAMILVLT